MIKQLWNIGVKTSDLDADLEFLQKVGATVVLRRVRCFARGTIRGRTGAAEFCSRPYRRLQDAGAHSVCARASERIDGEGATPGVEGHANRVP